MTAGPFLFVCKDEWYEGLNVNIGIVYRNEKILDAKDVNIMSRLRYAEIFVGDVLAK